jgi:hypothetical protein
MKARPRPGSRSRPRTTEQASGADLAAYCPNLGEWPRRWRYEERDVLRTRSSGRSRSKTSCSPASMRTVDRSFPTTNPQRSSGPLARRAASSSGSLKTPGRPRDSQPSDTHGPDLRSHPSVRPGLIPPPGMRVLLAAVSDRALQRHRPRRPRRSSASVRLPAGVSKRLRARRHDQRAMAEENAER